MSSFFQNDKDFVEYDSKNRTFVWICPIELNLFWNFTQWIEHFAQKDSKNWTLKDYLNNKTFLWLGELGLFFYLTQRIEFFLKNITQLLDQKLNTSFQHDSKKMSLFCLTQRIFLFDTMYDSKNKLIVFGKYDSKNWTFFQFDSKNWTLFLECDSKNWTFFSKWLKELFLFFSIWLKELNPLFWTCLKELKIDSENWTLFFFFNMTQRLDPLQKYDFQELNLLKIWIKGLNFWKCDSKQWTLCFNMSQRIEPTFPIWVKEMIFFFFWTWLTKLKELKLLLTNDSKSWTFLKKKHDSQNWTIFSCDSRNWTLLSNMSHRNWTFLFFSWLKELNPFFWIWLEEWTFFLGYDAKIDPFLLNFDKIKELNLLFKNGSKNWTFF